MDGKDFDFRNDTGTYQTGPTQPPKHHNGLIAFLIALVILLSGVSTALSILNLKLYRKLSASDASPRVAFFKSEDTSLPLEAVHGEVQELQTHLGISGTVIPHVYQRFYKLPNGIYVTRVANDSEAQEKGIIAGDIITSINGQTISSALLPELFTNCPEVGDTVELTLYRTGTELTLTLTWSNYD